MEQANLPRQGAPGSDTCKVRFIVSIGQEHAPVRIQIGIALAVHTNGAGSREQDLGGVPHRLAFDPAIHVAESADRWVVIFRHGIAKIHDPWLSGQTMEYVADQHCGGDGET